MSASVKVAGVWQPLTNVYVRRTGAWTGVGNAWGNNNGTWNKWWPPGGEVGPLPGTYVLTPTSLSLPSGDTGYAEFNTTSYRGRITQISARLSWKSASEPNGGVSATGRPSGTFYRNIDNNSGEWANRTIDHRIDTFNATSLTQFNNGSAIGFTFSKLGLLNIASQLSYVQLKLLIS